MAGAVQISSWPHILGRLRPSLRSQPAYRWEHRLRADDISTDRRKREFLESTTNDAEGGATVRPLRFGSFVESICHMWQVDLVTTCMLVDCLPIVR